MYSVHSNYKLFLSRPPPHIIPHISNIWLAHHSKLTTEAPQNGRFYFEVSSSSPLAQVHMWKEDKVCQAYGIKVRCYWELLGIHVRNLVTLCFDTLPNKQTKRKRSLHGMSTVHCPSGKWTMDSPFSTPNTTWKKHGSPSPHPQGKKVGHLLHSMTWLLIGCMEILFLKLAATIFGLD